MTGRIRILYLIGSLERGGTEGQLADLVLRLPRDRFEPAICCLNGTGPHADRVVAAGVAVEDLRFGGFQHFLTIGSEHPVAGVARLLRAIRRARPDILHAQLFWAYMLGPIAARVAGVRHVIAGRRSLLEFRKAIPAPLRLVDRVCSRRLTDLFIANSEAVRQETIRVERIPAEKILVIHNGLDLSRFDGRSKAGERTRLGLPGDAPIVAVVANLIHYKGHRWFLEAWADIVRRIPNAVALLAGDGPLRPTLEDTTRRLGLDRSVRFLGRCQDVEGVLAAADVLVHPSLEEGFSNAILEAMGASRPVIATRVGGNPEAVEDGVTGLLVPSRDSPALARATLDLLGDPVRASALGAAGRRRVEQEFTLSRMVARYEQVYAEMVGQT